ncbi:hypothetical protein AB0D14_11070 [Streptomyces sp. NPDC048484]|uniref:WXG100 family type VII secretion target n=1 Tax=Streptomyces sp. NPDC048484 TaxID=3155146 RepID=UPI0034176CB6
MGEDGKHLDQHKADLKQVAQQVGAIDAVTAVSEMLNNTFLGGGIRFFGKTDFEGHRLNDMVDLVERANPSDLESAGKALRDARDAITDAADELSGHIDWVDWEGEAGEAFRKWGKKLVTNTRGLADFAEVAGNQITAAGTGLASVKSSMPPRDARSDPKTVADIPTPARVEGNADYDAAMKAEDHRQEAINQMNRLSSFYAVSEEALAGQEPPTFEPMPGVGVPKPDPTRGEAGSETRAATGEPVTPSRAYADAPTNSPRGTDAPLPLKEVNGSVTYPGRDVGTEIASVGTLPPQTSSPTTGTPPPVSGPTGAGGGTAPLPFATGGAMKPLVGGPAGRSAGFGGGARNPASAQGRVGSATGGSSSGGAAGRGSAGPMGRAGTTTGQGMARSAGTGSGQTPMGRGVSGGTPRVGGTPAGGRAGGVGAGAGRGNGVVGGRPVTGPTPGATGSRVPRGTVVGGEGTGGSRAGGGRTSQRGVIGASNPTPGSNAGQTPRRSAGNSDGVVGTPKGRAPATRGNGFTAGGSGLVRGPVGNRRNPDRDPDRDEDEVRQRPDHPVEGQDTDQPGSRRRDVPPVVG